MALFSPDCTHVSPAGPQGADEWKAFAEALRSAVPDAHMEIVSVVEADEHGRRRGALQGHAQRHSTEQGEIPATGNTIDVRFADFFRLGDDTFVEHRVYWDQAEMMAQLSPAPPS